MAETLLLSTEEGKQPTHLSLLSQLLHDLLVHHVKPQSRTDESLLRSLVECVKEAIRGALPRDVLEAMDEVKVPSFHDELTDVRDKDEEAEDKKEFRSTLVRLGTDLRALAQVLEVLSAYEYKDEELSRLLGLYIETARGHWGTLEQSSEDCYRLYDLGKLEGMLHHYLHMEHAKLDAHPPSVLSFASGVARAFIPHIRNAFSGMV